MIAEIYLTKFVFCNKLRSGSKMLILKRSKKMIESRFSVNRQAEKPGDNLDLVGGNKNVTDRI